MILYIGVTIVTILIAYRIQNLTACTCGSFALGRQKKGTECHSNSRIYIQNKLCMFAIFTLLFFVSACRYEVGNDYKRYLEFYRLIGVGSYGDLPTEIGFNVLVRSMQLLFGSEIYLSIFALFAFLTLLLMLKALYELSEDFFFSFFLFMMFAYFFRSMNSMRYYLAIGGAMVSLKYVLKGQYGKFLCIILIASLFHKSALIVLPLYYLANRVWKKWQICFLALGCIIVVLFQKQLLNLILLIYPTYEGTNLLEGGTSIVNILLCFGVMILTLLYYREGISGNKQTNFYFHLNIFALILYTCCSFLPEISRIGYYLTMGHIFLLPMVIGRISNVRVRRFWKSLIMIMAGIYFVAFLYTAYQPLIKLLPYHTWFFEPKIQLTEFGG